MTKAPIIGGAPTPATTLVVQIEPGPIPTLTASAPTPIRAPVASLAAIITSNGTVFEIDFSDILNYQ